LIDIADEQQGRGSGKVRNNARISGTSTIEVSSTTSRSKSSGASSFRSRAGGVPMVSAFSFAAMRRKTPVLGSVLSSRWIVLASSLVLSERRLAARPVDRAERDLDALCEQDLQDRVDQCRLADPGPPVTTSTSDVRATRTAPIWLSASFSLVVSRPREIALSACHMPAPEWGSSARRFLTIGQG